MVIRLKRLVLGSALVVMLAVVGGILLATSTQATASQPSHTLVAEYCSGGQGPCP